MAFPNWTHTPIPGVSLSASGLLALADLSTIAQRTAITGGSSWLDSLLLAPGLHYQQAAEDLLKGSGSHTLSDTSNDALVEESNGVSGQDTKRVRIKNVATAAYIRRIANTRPGETVTLDVGAVPRSRRSWNWDLGAGGLVSRKKVKIKMRRSDSGMHAVVWAEEDNDTGSGGGGGGKEDDQEKGQDEEGEDMDLDLGWVSHLLYLASPVLTITAAVLVVLLRDWWALAQLLGLMTSRLLNIWVIKQRTKRQHNQKPKRQEPPVPDPSSLDPSPMSTMTTAAPSRAATPKPGLVFPQPLLPVIPQSRSQPRSTQKEPITSYTISLPSCHNNTSPDEDEPPPTSVRLRGKPSDLEAITASTWLRAKTHVEGYLEAMAKLVVYGVAAFSGNTSQAGAIIMMGLLLVTAGLLALSNSHAKSLTVNGRVVVDVDSCGRSKKTTLGGIGKGRTGLDKVLVGGGLENGNGRERGEKKVGGVIEGEAINLGARVDSRKEADEEEGLGRNDANTWSDGSSPRSGQSGEIPQGQVGLGLDGLDDAAADRAEKGQMRHSAGSSLPS